MLPAWLRSLLLSTMLPALLLAACSPVATSLPAAVTPLPSAASPFAELSLQPPATPTDPPVPTGSPSPAFSATPTPPPSAPRYTLEVAFDFDRASAVVAEEIVYSNRSGEPLPDLRLVIPPAQYAGSFNLAEITWGDGQPVSGAGWQEDALLVPLPQPLPPGASLTLKLRYDLALPAQASFNGPRPIPFGYTEQQANLVDWYPFVPPYVPGKGWLVNPPGYYGEHLTYEMADFEVRLTLTGQRGGLVVAASAPETEVDGALHYQLQDARNFALSISPDYQVTTHQAGAVEIVSYAYPAHAFAGRAAGETTAASVSLYSGLFGQYPRARLTVVEADFFDGMEYDGLYFLSKGFYNLYAGTPGEYLVAIAAHETAHQWWYARVGNDQGMEPWLDEALCTYSERLYYEKAAPGGLRWWWDARVNFYQPSGWVDSSIYDHRGLNDNYRAYRDAVYLNGALFLEELRKAVGDEAFFAFLKDYAQRFDGKIATRDGFFSVLAEHTTVDVNPLVARFFRP